MRVAEISVHSCPRRPLGSGDVGGMNLYILSIVQEMNKLGIEVDIFARRHDSDEPQIIRLNEKTRLMPGNQEIFLRWMSITTCQSSNPIYSIS